jgi:hypothetical protein
VVAAASSGVSRLLKVAAIGAGLMTGGGLIGAGSAWLGGLLGNRNTHTERTIERQSGSVLPYLEEGGYHLPPAK